MPELPEVETYRRLAERALDRTIDEVVAPDAWYLKRGLTARAAAAALTGRRFTAARRRGKTLYLDSSDDGPVLKLGFGMSGRLVVDGIAGIDRLLGDSEAVEASARAPVLERWDRFAVRFEDGGDLRMRDPRRLGRVELDADESRLGPDAVGLTPAGLRAVLGTSTAPLKARLMDQARLAGVGNLIADELLWRAGPRPPPPVRSRRATCGASTVTSSRRWRISSRAGRTPARSCPSAGPAACARRTARPSSGARSAAARPGRAPPTSSEPVTMPSASGCAQPPSRLLSAPRTHRVLAVTYRGRRRIRCRPGRTSPGTPIRRPR